MAAAGRRFAQANVAAIYCLHGTFAGNDALGLYTEVERFAPRLASSLRRATKSAFDWLIGETGNYTAEFAERMETALAAGAERPIPVRRFHWAAQNHHISRADAAVRLVDELAQVATQLEDSPVPFPRRGWAQPSTGDPKSPERRALDLAKQPGRGEAAGTHVATRPRIQLWSHSHGGNALALLTNLLAADEPTRQEFFEAAGVFHNRSRLHSTHFPVWHRVEQILADPTHPLRNLAIDVVTFGTPVRYGWDTGGFNNLLHIVNHRPHPKKPEHVAPYPPRFGKLLLGADGDFIQQIGIAGTNLPPLPIAWRTFLADRRLRMLFERDLAPEWLRTRLKRGVRVHHEGTTLLMDYADPDRSPHRHLFGHAPYTRSRWMARHCELIAEHFYGKSSGAV
jgi:hypothetical protein